MLDQRLGRLEDILGRLEPMIVDLARTAVRQVDLAAFRNELRAETKSDLGSLRAEMKSDVGSLRAEMKSEFALLRAETATKSGVAELRTDVRGVEARVVAVHADIAELKGRIKGVEDRFAYFPTTLQMMSIIATMLIGLTGIIFVAGRYFRP